MSTVPKEYVVQAESADQAQQKVDAQRDLLAKLSMDSPTRSEQERVLDVLIKNVALAKFNEALLSEDKV